MKNALQSITRVIGRRLASPLHFVGVICCLTTQIACSQDTKQAPLVPVYNRGSMKEVFKDNASAKVDLSELKSTEHLYALGPLSKLRGEILIWDSMPFESRVNQQDVQVKSDWNESAAFLVWSAVEKWEKVKVPPAVRSIDSLEMWLDSMSGKPGYPLRGQYPFLIKGRFGRVLWHIADLKDDGTPLTPENQQSQQFHGQSKDIKAEMLGFYSPEHQGIFIAKGRHLHLHIRLGEQLVAHVDDFDSFGDNGLTLYVPGR